MKSSLGSIACALLLPALACGVPILPDTQPARTGPIRVLVPEIGKGEQAIIDRLTGLKFKVVVLAWQKVVPDELKDVDVILLPTQWAEDDNIYKMWEDLLQMSDTAERDAQLRKIGNYKFENFEIIPLFDVFIEVVLSPNIVKDWPFPGWDGGDVGHTFLISACKQEKPCK